MFFPCMSLIWGLTIKTYWTEFIGEAWWDIRDPSWMMSHKFGTLNKWPHDKFWIFNRPPGPSLLHLWMFSYYEVLSPFPNKQKCFTLEVLEIKTSKCQFGNFCRFFNLKVLQKLTKLKFCIINTYKSWTDFNKMVKKLKKN